jgi:hypothetical protein
VSRGSVSEGSVGSIPGTYHTFLGSMRQAVINGQWYAQKGTGDQSGRRATKLIQRS